jgi:hypothetical protein
MSLGNSHRRTHRRKAGRALLAAVVALVATSVVPASASAEIGPELFRFGQTGTGAGELENRAQGGIDTNPDTGHIFITDAGNNRVSEFTAWGEFVKAWGWGVRDGSPELQTCTEQTGCQEGIFGGGAGQFAIPTGIAVDPSGNIFVFESSLTSGMLQQRVQKFSPAGEFLLMIGGEVNKTTGEDICTRADLEAGETCGPGVFGSGPGEFSRNDRANTWRDNIDIGPDGLLYVADRARIQSFDLNGAFQGELSFSTIEASDPEFPDPASNTIGTLDIDPVTGDFLIVFPDWELPRQPSAWRVQLSGAVVEPAPLVSGTGSPPSERLFPEATSTDPQGNAYVPLSPASPSSAFTSPTGDVSLWQFDPAGTRIGECCFRPATNPTGRDAMFALATNTVTPAGGIDLYIAHSIGPSGGGPDPRENFIEVRGTPPEKWPAPPAPPTIAAQYATTVRSESAVLKADINPNFWADTRYRLQFGTSPCSLGGCEEVIAAPGTLLGAGVVKRSVTTEGVSLSGLKAGTTYHYRFVAESGGGGPVFGEDRTFTTYANPTAASSTCPNQALRTGSSAALADCRAFEMVSPIDKAGGEVIVLGNNNSTPTGLRQATPGADKLTYTSYRSYADAEGAPYSVQYIASRGPEGWATDNISPPRDAGELQGVRGLDSWYKGFLDDLSVSWLVTSSDPPLAEGALTGYPNLYRRTSATDTYEALTTATPASTSPVDYNIEVQGFTADGARTVFRANAKLTKPAAAAGSNVHQLYENVEGSLRLVSVLPDGTAATGGATVGTQGNGLLNGRDANVETAVSEDGTRIYWQEEKGDPKEGRKDGQLYLREEGSPTMTVSAGGATFWAATPDGAQALYTEAGALKLFDRASTSSSTLVAPGVTGVMGASEDLSRIYLVSTADLAEDAKAGEPNLYLYQEGEALRLIGTLGQGDGDVSPGAFSPVAVSPRFHAARVSADGSRAVFMSRAPLTGADNQDVASGEPVSQVFRYDAEADQLLCVSCNPTGALPVGYEPVVDAHKGDYWVSASFPTGEFQHHFPRIVSSDGDRVFFQSSDRLSVSDTNGKIDVYQWEALGRGECTGPASPGHNPKAGGCVTLISDGQGATDSELVDASADGDSVFLATGVSLLPQDPGQVDLYVARAGGGYPPPPAPPAPCEGEACQPAATPPPASPFSSQTFVGPGNKPKKARKRCKRTKGARKRGAQKSAPKGKSKGCAKRRNLRRAKGTRGAKGGRG